jgi:hypothetical protein
MLLLQGENQKAVVFNELGKTLDCIVLSDTFLSMQIDYYQYDEFDAVNISNLIAQQVDKRFSWILLYTNTPKEKLSKEIEWLKHLEKERVIVNSILACK